MDNTFQPKDLDDAIEYIIEIIHKNEESINMLEKHKNDENGFIAQLHPFFGMSIRNTWFLWWYEGHDFTDNWPKETPSIVKYFNNIKIYHADDMSGIILTSVYRKFFNLPINLEEQIKVYHEHWLKYVGNIDYRIKK